MAMDTGGLTRSRVGITVRQLEALLLAALAATAMLFYVTLQRDTVLPSGGLSETAIQNSGAFAREQGAVQPAEIHGSGAYLRELPAPAVVFSAEAIWSSGASVREQAPERSSGFDTTWAQAREGTPAGTRAASHTSRGSGAHFRESPN